jgi:dolichol-phosphate mannosyltransferase
MLLLAIICPVWNEEPVIPLFLDRMLPIMHLLSDRYEVELVFLNNASTDRTLDSIAAVREQWPETYVISMSRNVGYQASLECGLRTIDADLFTIIDVDCEDPPEMLPQFVASYESGYDIAYGERVDRPEPGPIKAARRLFYRLLQRVADDDVILDMAEFSLFTRDVRDAIIDEHSSFPFLRTSISRVGFRRLAIPFTREHRIAGTTHYNVLGMSLFALAGLLAASTLLLRLPIYILPFWLIALGTLGVWSILIRSEGIALLTFIVFASYVGASLSFIALYVARAYKNGLRRPNAVIDRRRSTLPPRRRASQ